MWLAGSRVLKRVSTALRFRRIDGLISYFASCYGEQTGKQEAPNVWSLINWHKNKLMRTRVRTSWTNCRTEQKGLRGGGKSEKRVLSSRCIDLTLKDCVVFLCCFETFTAQRSMVGLRLLSPDSPSRSGFSPFFSPGLSYGTTREHHEKQITVGKVLPFWSPAVQEHPPTLFPLSSVCLSAC